MTPAERSLSDFERFIDDLTANRIQWTSEEIAAAAAVEKRMREHPISDDDAIKAATAFICFTPLGGE
jgi:hypothetical protein